MKKLALFCTGPLLLLMVAGFTGGPAIADAIKTVIIRNPDEPGRTPAEFQARFSAFDCLDNTCSSFQGGGPMLLDLEPPVPAGKRLVVRHVSGVLLTRETCDVSAVGCAVAFQQTTQPDLDQFKWSFWGPFFVRPYNNGQAQQIAFSTDAFFTVGPGERPHAWIRHPPIAGPNLVSSIVLSGYLINAN